MKDLIHICTACPDSPGCNPDREWVYSSDNQEDIKIISNSMIASKNGITNTSWHWMVNLITAVQNDIVVVDVI